jgi:RNA polymerase sigma factor (sigma-70 family)
MITRVHAVDRGLDTGRGADWSLPPARCRVRCPLRCPLLAAMPGLSEDAWVTMDLIEAARAGDGDAFGQLIVPYEPELRALCYRMLGSAQDAEDALQEALLAAWQGLAGFEGRASLRTWLYRVVTTRCLNARRSASRRRGTTAPPGLAPPEPTRLGEVTWIEPYPDALLDGIADASPGPEARYEGREAISLAFVTALQQLPPRQRAVLILRDVLGFTASEAAQILGCTWIQRQAPRSGCPVPRGDLLPRGTHLPAGGNPGQRAAGVRRLPARTRSEDRPGQLTARTHPHRDPDLRDDPLRGQRADSRRTPRSPAGLSAPSSSRAPVSTSPTRRQTRRPPWRPPTITPSRSALADPRTGSSTAPRNASSATQPARRTPPRAPVK